MKENISRAENVLNNNKLYPHKNIFPFPFKLNCEYDRGNSFPFDHEPNQS